MFETFSEEQPQWVYPPVGYLGHGPSGVAWVTGEALPKGLAGKFFGYQLPGIGFQVRSDCGKNEG